MQRKIKIACNPLKYGVLWRKCRTHSEIAERAVIESHSLRQYFCYLTLNVGDVRGMSKRAILIAFFFCSAALYETPYFLTLSKTGCTPLPPVFAPDQMYYLNLSNIHHATATKVVNPWYGDLVETRDVPHMMFPIAFLLFRGIRTIFSSWTIATLVWVGVWAGLAFAAAVFCLDSFFPGADSWLTALGGLGLLVLHLPLVYVAEIRQLPSIAGLLQLLLPYLRFPFPQVIVPAVLVYWGLQARALKSASKLALAGMACMQFFVCAAFPYMLPLIAIGTGFTILIAQCRQGEINLRWPAITAFAVLCGVMDVGYLLLVGFFKSQGNVHFALQFRPQLILPNLRPYVLLLVIASGLALISRASFATRATAAALALSNAVFGFSDVFLRGDAQMVDHPHYLIGITSWLPVFVFLWSFAEKLNKPLRIALISSLTLISAWEAFASYRYYISDNLLQAREVTEVRALALTGKDLVIAPSRFPDDISSWIPLISPAKVIYTGDGENVLSAADTQTQQAFRQALYLMMTGMDLASLTSITENDNLENQFTRLLQQGDRAEARSPLAEDRRRVRSRVQNRLGPKFAQLEADPASAGSLLGGFDRVIVIDSVAQPVFNQAVFSRWLTVERSYERNGTRAWICRYKTEY